VGLAVVLLRNLIERRGELAMLSALGFGRWDRMALVLAENMALLVTGLLLGAGCAVLAVLPAIISSSRWIHLSQLGGALGAIFLVGTLAMVAALWRGSRWIAAVDLRVE